MSDHSGSAVGSNITNIKNLCTSKKAKGITLVTYWEMLDMPKELLQSVYTESVSAAFFSHLTRV